MSDQKKLQSCELTGFDDCHELQDGSQLIQTADCFRVQRRDDFCQKCPERNIKEQMRLLYCILITLSTSKCIKLNRIIRVSFLK